VIRPEVFGGGELKDIRSIVSDLPVPYPGDDQASIGISRKQTHVLVKQYRRRLSGLGGNARLDPHVAGNRRIL
jgi:hypothetical protein